jgi:hypothetical protein
MKIGGRHHSKQTNTRLLV